MRARALTPVLLLALAACSSGPSFAQPKASAFAPGSCHDLADPVLSLGRDLHSLGAKAPSTKQAEAIKADQTRIRSVGPSVAGELQPRVQKLITTVGILRLRNDTDSYDAGLARDAMTAYRELVTACTSA